MQGKEIADSGLQLERIVRLVARKGSIVEVTGYSTGVFLIYRTHYYWSKSLAFSTLPSPTFWSTKGPLDSKLTTHTAIIPVASY